MKENESKPAGDLPEIIAATRKEDLPVIVKSFAVGLAIRPESKRVDVVFRFTDEAGRESPFYALPPAGATDMLMGIVQSLTEIKHPSSQLLQAIAAKMHES